MDKAEDSKLVGKFTVPPGRDVYGELTLSGPNTTLYLHNKDEFNALDIPGQYIKGVLNDLTKVSLMRCIALSGLGSATKGEESYHFATVFPHFVVSGSRHLAPDEKSIAEIHFTIDDASTLFYDFDAFGSLIDARPFIETIVKANALPREIETGPDPQILYFTGKREIFSADTILGTISASHNPSHTLGGPNGVRLKNTIFVSIAFKDPLAFEESFGRASTLLRYLGMLVGRPQNLLALNLRMKSDQERPVFLTVYSTMSPKRELSNEENKPHPADVLLDAVRRREEFSRVLTNWLERQEHWNDARLRFFNSFAEQNRYDPDRLIASANMFDILPSSAVPPDVPLSDELKAAKEVSRNAFGCLPTSPERDSVLNVLGRIGKCGLKQKIRYRAQRVANAAGDRFPDLATVTDQAVNCRNFYVHGGERSFDYAATFNIVTFLVDTLEFVFAASDLIEAGWDLKTWSSQGATMTHPFDRFRIDYPRRLQELKTALSAENTSHQR